MGNPAGQITAVVLPAGCGRFLFGFADGRRLSAAGGRESKMVQELAMTIPIRTDNT